MLLLPILLSLLGFLSEPQPKFEAQTIDEAVQIGYGMAIGDVDGDGKPDILLADKKEFVWYRNGDWKRQVMAANLTAADNVCLTARDLDGDGKVEVAVGAQWNPGETSDTEKSGAVFYLIRPDDHSSAWEARPLHHEPTTHRMRWVKSGGKSHLIVVPLHGRGNKNGEGTGVKVIAYEFPENPAGDWKMTVIEESMHLTHNLEVVSLGADEGILLGGKEGARLLTYSNGKWKNVPIALSGHGGIGELRLGRLSSKNQFLVTVEPMHGSKLVVYEEIDPRSPSKEINRIVLTEQLKEGHALAIGDFLNLGSDQIAVGWRTPNEHQEIGIKLFIPKNGSYSEFEEIWIDRNGMACEDLQAADLDGDGKLDLIASGRSTKNLKIYWNRN